MSPSVITSRAAQQDFDKIKSEHSTILTGLADHQMRMEQQNQVKAQKLAEDNSMRNEMEKERMVADTTQKKDAMTFAQKQMELDIKRAALAQV